MREGSLVAENAGAQSGAAVALVSDGHCKPPEFVGAKSVHLTDAQDQWTSRSCWNQFSRLVAGRQTEPSGRRRS